MDIARPKEAGVHPAVIAIHGGGWNSGDRSSYTQLILRLAQHGYVAAAIDYRLAPAAQFPSVVAGAHFGYFHAEHSFYCLPDLNFGDRLSGDDANTFTPASPWGIFIVLVPVVGALIVTLLVTKFAPEARGHGVPEVMDAVYYSEGRIRPMVAAIKSLASSLSIGSGAAVGREGPIIQIGASLGSTIGQIIPLAAWQRITLVAAGAGSGIAATFNTPIGGVMFAVELMMPLMRSRSVTPGNCTRIWLSPSP